MITSIAGAVSFLMGIIVLIKLFQTEGVIKGILGFLCMLYTYFWGWQHAKEQNLTNVMWIWTAVIVLSIIVSAFFGTPTNTGGGEPEGLVRFFFI